MKRDLQMLFVRPIFTNQKKNQILFKKNENK